MKILLLIFSLCCYQISSLAEEQIKTDKSRTTAEGAALGCALGAVVSVLTKGDGKDVVKGCVAGGALGGVYGNHVAGKKQDYLNQETHYQAVIEHAQKVALKARDDYAHLQGRISRVREEQDKLETRNYNVFRKTKKQMQQNKRVGKVIKEMEESIATVNNEILMQKQYMEEQRPVATVALISASQENITSLEREKRQLEILEAELRALDERRSH